MLKIWMDSTNQKYCSCSVKEIIRVVFLIILNNYFIIAPDRFRKAEATPTANANLVPEQIIGDLVNPTPQISANPDEIQYIYLPIANPQAWEVIDLDNLFLFSISDPMSSLKTALFIVPNSTPDRTPVLLPNAQPIPNPIKDPRYQIAPRTVDLAKLNPALTQIVVNDVPLTHRSQFEVTGGTDIGDRSTTNPLLNATRLDSLEAQESVSNNRIYRTEYRSNYSQLRTVRQQRNIITTIRTPETVFGFRQQISFVGDCINGIVSPTGVKEICTYVPGLKTDESSIDPKTLIPSRIFPTSQFGDVVTPASLLAIKAPGFQGGANGQLLGLDLYFPRVGAEVGNSQSKAPSYDRFESTTTVPTISFGRIHQVILANGRETAIARTVRGTNYVLNDRNTSWMAGIQAATELLPNVEPFLTSGKRGGSIEVDRSLLVAANNNRIPENSFTAYYGGIGSGFTPTDSRASTSNYRGIWLGFSPVVDRQISSSGDSFQAISGERVTLSSGGEGGIETGASVTALLNQNNFNSSAVSNAYVQTYLTRYEREGTTTSSSTIRERTDYLPHLSATGNVTSPDSAFRYYTGVIFNPNRTSSSSTNKAYVGIDYTKVERRGFNYNFAFIGYANPDPEYYSKLNLNFSKQVPLGKNPAYNLSLSGTINYVLDGAKVYDAVNFRSASSFLNIGATTNLGDVSVGASYYIATNLPNSIGNLLSTSAAWKINSELSLSASYTPLNENQSRSPFGASANIRLGSNPSAPTLSLSWNRNEIDLGVDSNNNRTGIADNVFSAYIRFDAPLNSFR
jgi:hypothetical protein